MTNANAVNANSGVSFPSYAGDMRRVSPDALLEYCQIQLGGLDSQITDQVNQQNKMLAERTAVEHVQTALENFGTQGPQNRDQMTQCVDAFQKAIASLPTGDPVAAQLQTQCDAMTKQYGYDAGGTPTAAVVLPIRTLLTNLTFGTQAGLANPPQNDDWKGTTDALSTLAGDVKSNAEIDMLNLQDLVSQRQQAVQLCSGIMSKTDQTLEAQAKAIGQ
jgi:hypothetical protein